MSRPPRHDGKTGVVRTRERRLLQTYLPILGWLPGYDRRWLGEGAVFDTLREAVQASASAVSTYDRSV